MHLVLGVFFYVLASSAHAVLYSPCCLCSRLGQMGSIPATTTSSPKQQRPACKRQKKAFGVNSASASLKKASWKGLVKVFAQGLLEGALKGLLKIVFGPLN